MLRFLLVEAAQVTVRRFFLEATDLCPGMDPEKATKLRQVRFDLQES
jgi:hypothetical protein